MKSFTGPDGPALYLARVGSTGAGVQVWNGASLVAPPTGLGFAAFVDALEVFDDGSGPSLYAAGVSLSPSISQNEHIARLTGSTWTIVPGGPSSQITALEVHDDGNGPALYASGPFRSLVTGQSVPGMARWNGSAWTAFGGDIVPRASGLVGAMRSIDPDGPGPQQAVLYVGGTFNSLGGVPASNIALWGGCGCYANCDQSTGVPTLTANDFVCFMALFASANPSANCDRSTAAPVLNGNDFVCFLNAYVAGCP